MIYENDEIFDEVDGMEDYMSERDHLEQTIADAQARLDELSDEESEFVQGGGTRRDRRFTITRSVGRNGFFYKIPSGGKCTSFYFLSNPVGAIGVRGAYTNQGYGVDVYQRGSYRRGTVRCRFIIQTRSENRIYTCTIKFV